MCGRAAQTVHASHCAASSFGLDVSSRPTAAKKQDDFENDDGSQNHEGGSSVAYQKIDRDNYNMSPGMDAAVMWMENGRLKMDRKVYVITNPKTSLVPQTI
mmetsp:Transcript_73677/g.213444  ORF Transcript_73677/g.213444 Transcript_73677/m.213444 type:complete len:101 (+) Transcript_73677:200-502(+)